MRCRREHRQVRQHGNIVWPMIECVVADEDAVRLAAQLAEFLLIDLAEDRALIPGRAAEFAQGTPEFALADIQYADLDAKLLVRGAHQHLQSAPCRFGSLEFRRMQDRIELRTYSRIDPGDHRFYGEVELMCRGHCSSKIFRQNRDGIARNSLRGCLDKLRLPDRFVEQRFKIR